MNRSDSNPTRGFTLIELIVAIAVAAILMTIAVPSLKNLIRDNRVTGQTNELVAMINFARNEAIRRNDTISVVLTNSADGWSGLVEDPEGDGSASCTAQGALRCADYSDVQLTSGSTNIAFNNRGYLTPFSEINLALEHTDCSGDSQRREIEILPTGQVSSSLAACSG